MKKTLVTFIIASVVFEIIALVVVGAAQKAPNWVWLLDIIVVLALLYLAVRGIIGWVREVKRDLPQVQKGIIVRKRHWHFP